MARNKIEKHKLNTATFKLDYNKYSDVYDLIQLLPSNQHITTIKSKKEALDYLQQCNYDISYLEE